MVHDHVIQGVLDLEPPPQRPPKEKGECPAKASPIQVQISTEDNTTARQPCAPQRKWARVLVALLAGRSFNRFEAARDLRDWCIHSTASNLQARGLIINRRDEVVPGFQGNPTHVCRYWLAPESRDRAVELLARRPGGRAR